MDRFVTGLGVATGLRGLAEWYDHLLNFNCPLSAIGLRFVCNFLLGRQNSGKRTSSLLQETAKAGQVLYCPVMKSAIEIGDGN